MLVVLPKRRRAAKCAASGSSPARRIASNAGVAVLPYVYANPAKEGGKATAAYALSVIGSGHGREPIVVDLENDPYAKKAPC